MNELTAVCGITVLALVLTLTLKKDAPAIAFLLTLTAGIMILVRVLGACSDLVRRLGALLERGGITGSLYLPVAKAVGVAMLVRIMSALCRDAGQSALAAKLEIAGTVLALSLCLPLLEQVVALAADWTF
ncbi:MAG: SpoIIIAC/SpoIIIAD family protein [Agathobaculum sp.]|uniref:SpoIIIAC/SpoIIIAD family protein n=1 Tax=Agathobaculum sp. TaxID=2048138 RepID=UPI003D8C98AA